MMSRLLLALSLVPSLAVVLAAQPVSADCGRLGFDAGFWMTVEALPFRATPVIRPVTFSGPNAAAMRWDFTAFDRFGTPRATSLPLPLATGSSCARTVALAGTGFGEDILLGSTAHTIAIDTTGGATRRFRGPGFGGARERDGYTEAREFLAFEMGAGFGSVQRAWLHDFDRITYGTLQRTGADFPILVSAARRTTSGFLDLQVSGALAGETVVLAISPLLRAPGTEVPWNGTLIVADVWSPYAVFLGGRPDQRGRVRWRFANPSFPSGFVLFAQPVALDAQGQPSAYGGVLRVEF